jgi:acetyl esterase
MLQQLKVSFFRRYYRFRSWRAWRADNVHDSPGGLALPTAGGTIPAHLYHGSAAAGRPRIVYYHGGGWVIGDLQTHHAYCRALAEASGCSVIAVDYRLAPEYPFPAALDDALAAAALIAERGDDFGPSNGGIVLAGDSAGGNLAACVALDAGPALRERLVGTLLIYPVVDHYSAPYPSYQDCARGQALTSDVMRWFWDTYLDGADPGSAAGQRALPIRRPLASMPDTILCTAGRDPLRDEGMAFAQALQRAGVGVDHAHYPDSEHGFACTMGPTPDYEDWLQRCARWLAARPAAPPQ